jgi:DNA-directed RNA polymerase subunit N (RpoN/RPB10)
MGPLVACFNCGRNLAIIVEIINLANIKKLGNITSEQISMQEIKTDIVEIFDALHLQECCRNDLITHIDLSSEIYV